MAAIRGRTLDKDGSTLGSCKCFLFKDNSPGASFIGHTTSDVDGWFLFTGIGDTDASYTVYAVKDDTPHIFDAMYPNLQPIAGV